MHAYVKESYLLSEEPAETHAHTHTHTELTHIRIHRNTRTNELLETHAHTHTHTEPHTHT